jgi:hypothetical protein
MAHLPRPPHLAPPHDGVVSGLFLGGINGNATLFSYISHNTWLFKDDSCGYLAPTNLFFVNF